MYFVYVLKNDHSEQLYIGFTSNLDGRLKGHEFERPGYKLVYYEAYKSEKDARQRERKLKAFGSAYGHLKARIERSLDREGRKGGEWRKGE